MTCEISLNSEAGLCSNFATAYILLRRPTCSCKLSCESTEVKQHKTSCKIRDNLLDNNAIENEKYIASVNSEVLNYMLWRILPILENNVLLLFSDVFRTLCKFR